MSHPESAGIRAMKSAAPEPISERSAYMIRGALVGFALGVAMVVTTSWHLWLLVAATVVGSITGLELYFTRRWERFGRFTPTIRFTVACTDAAALTSAAGVLLRLIPSQLAWSFTAFGAIVGLLYGIFELGTSD